MSLPDVVSRDQWLDARRRLLAQEKEMTRRQEALNATRRRLPMVTVDKEYVFEGPDGPVALAQLFGDKPAIRPSPAEWCGSRNSRYPGRVYLIPIQGLSNTRPGFRK